VVLYSFQAIIENEELTNNKYKDLIQKQKKSMTEVVKMLEFRKIFMSFLENYLILSGFKGKIAVLGRDLSVQLKMKKKSLMVFSICNTFMLLLYDLPYIPLPFLESFNEDYFSKLLLPKELAIKH
jgi:hypothetical protein